MARATVYGDDPAAQARLFADAGASHLHVVDLDGAFAGTSVNGAAVESIIAAFPGKVQVGGGIRDRAGVDRWLALGVERVIIGTAAPKAPEFVKSAARDLPGRIVVGVDARDGMVARSEEHTSELQSLMRISYAVFCLKKKTLTIDLLHK